MYQVSKFVCNRVWSDELHSQVVRRLGDSSSTQALLQGDTHWAVAWEPGDVLGTNWYLMGSMELILVASRGYNAILSVG
jgi:hypothetical protein